MYSNFYTDFFDVTWYTIPINIIILFNDDRNTWQNYYWAPCRKFCFDLHCLRCCLFSLDQSNCTNNCCPPATVGHSKAKASSKQSEIILAS